MSAHTPGPWRVASGPEMPSRWPRYRGVFVRGATHCFLAEMIGGTGNEIADTHLICAAPDLLASCEAVARLFDPEGDMGASMNAALADCRAAIAKARPA